MANTASASREAPQSAIGSEWYHTIELAPGIVTRRPQRFHVPPGEGLPARLKGGPHAAMVAEPDLGGR